MSSPISTAQQKEIDNVLAQFSPEVRATVLPLIREYLASRDQGQKVTPAVFVTKVLSAALRQEEDRVAKQYERELAQLSDKIVAQRTEKHGTAAKAPDS